MDEFELIQRVVVWALITIVTLLGGGAMGGLKIRSKFNGIGEERKIDAGLIGVLQDTVEGFRAELQIVRDEKNTLAEDVQTLRTERNTLATKFDTKVKALEDAESNLQDALAQVDEQKTINNQQALKLRTTTGALDTLRREFTLQKSVLDELLPLAGKVEVMSSQITTLQSALADTDQKRIDAERELRELQQISSNKDEQILMLERRVDTVEQSNRDLRRLVESLQPDPDPPLKIVDPNFTPKDEDAEKSA